MLWIVYMCTGTGTPTKNTYRLPLRIPIVFSQVWCVRFCFGNFINLMNFKHQYFFLDTKSRKVFDENAKELRLTGNAYRMLVFLCEHGPATITDIGEYLDGEKDYDENHIRQYRYKINTIIGPEVLQYKYSIYSIIGDVKKIDVQEKNNRITDLLHPDDVKSEYKNISTEKPDNQKQAMIKRFFTLVYILGLMAIFLSLPAYIISEFNSNENLKTSYKAKCLSNNEYIVLQGSHEPYVFKEQALNNDKLETKKDLNFYCKYYDEIQPFIASHDGSFKEDLRFIKFKNSVASNVFQYPPLYKLESINIFPALLNAIKTWLQGATIAFIILQFFRICFVYITRGKIEWVPFKSTK